MKDMWRLLALLVFAMSPALSAADGTPEASSGVPLVEVNPLNVPTEYEIASGLRVGYYRFLQQESGAYRILGEYTNTGDERIIAPVLRFTFTDPKGNQFWVGLVDPVQNFLEPTETGIFHGSISASDLPLIEGAQSLAVKTCNTSFFGPTGSVDLEITSPPLEPNADGTRYAGMLELTNVGTLESEQPAVYAISRDEDGLIDMVSMDFLNGSIPPGTFLRGNVSLIAPGPPSTTEIVAFEFGQLSVGCG